MPKINNLIGKQFGRLTLTIGDYTYPLAYWCEVFRMNYQLVYMRLKLGRTIEQAFCDPVGKRRVGYNYRWH